MARHPAAASFWQWTARIVAPGLAVAAGLALAPATAWGYFEDIDRGTAQERSTFHYELTRVLARAAGFSVADTELLAVVNVTVDLTPFTSLSGAPTVDLSGTDRMEEVTAKYFHFPRRPAHDASSWQYPGGRDTCSYFASTTDPCGPDGGEVATLEGWAMRGTATPAVAVPVQASVNGGTMQPVQGGTLLALAVYLHSLADSYSHEKCMADSHTRKHALSPPSCTTEFWHGQAEYGSSGGGVSYTREAARAVFHELTVFASGHGATPVWSEEQAAAFIDAWAGTNQSADRRDLADQACDDLDVCTLDCTATVPQSASAGAAVSFQGTATASRCSESPSLTWEFGDAGTSSLATASHSYSAAGSYTWTFSARAGQAVCTRSGSIVVTATPASFVYLVPSVAHAPGSAGTNWRTDVAAVNSTTGGASLTLTWFDSTTGAPAAVTRALAAGATVEWRDILVSLFGVGTGESRKGTLQVASSTPLVITSRTYNQETETRTYGQYYPALGAKDAIAAGKTGVLAQLKKSTAFRTNVGVVNLGTGTCNVTISLFDATGAQAGSPRTLTVEAGRWKQQDDIFTATGAGSRDLAYATVEVATSGGQVWAYASVIDAATGDPTTIPVVVP
jgi:hypothetical protein